MTHYHEHEPVRTVRERTYSVYGWTVNESALRRIIGLIQLAFVILNGLIALRFLLKLMAANPASPFAQLVYFFTAPFLWPFQGITYTPTFAGVEVEFFSLIAIAVYSLVAWIITRLIWLMFARMR